MQCAGPPSRTRSPPRVACCSGRPWGDCAANSLRTRRAAPSCSACAMWRSSATAARAPRGSRMRCGSPPMRCAATPSIEPKPWSVRAVSAAVPSAPRSERKKGMNRDEVLTMVRSHLSEELEVEPAKIDDGTRFKEDLDADSLDLYELVMELEDRYGITMSEEQASKILTVGSAVDFVVDNAPS